MGAAKSTDNFSEKERGAILLRKIISSISNQSAMQGLPSSIDARLSKWCC
jgi:hypothetical protein